jgi:5'(3')-deoxyribonucleotidase
MMPTILLDMDGVTVQCVQAMLRLHGCEDRMATWPKGEYALEDVCGVDRPTFWAKVEEASPDIWIDMEEYPYFDAMVKELTECGEVFFLSSPGWSAASAQGKIIWLQNRFGRAFRHYVLTNQKHLLARPDAILVDDFGRNCEAFREGGGRAVLYPRPWNDGPILDDVTTYQRVMAGVQGHVEALAGG